MYLEKHQSVRDSNNLNGIDGNRKKRVRTATARHNKCHVYVLLYDVSDTNLMSSSVTESYLAKSRWRRSDFSFFYRNSNHQKAAHSNHSIHCSHDHNTTTLDTGRYSPPSTRPRKEAMLGNVTDHQAAETDKRIAMQRTTVGTT